MNVTTMLAVIPSFAIAAISAAGVALSAHAEVTVRRRQLAMLNARAQGA